MAVIEFQCDHQRTGNEGNMCGDAKVLEGGATAEFEKRKNLLHTSEDEEDNAPDGEKSSLRFVSYGSSGEDTDVLRLNWLTKYACEDAQNEDGDNGDDGKVGKDRSGSHWGFFTWFLIM